MKHALIRSTAAVAATTVAVSVWMLLDNPEADILDWLLFSILSGTASLITYAAVSAFADAE